MHVLKSFRSRARARALALLALAFVVSSLALAACKDKEPTPEPVVVAIRTARPTFTPFPTATERPPTATATEVVIQPTMTPVPPTPTVAQATTPTPDGSINPLTGSSVADPSLLDRRILAVRIGNDPEIRPQEGLGQADIVYEEIMEGWTITRYTALFWDKNVERIRPLRSARLTSLSIVPQYDAASVHSGASDKIRWLISESDIIDLDQFYHPEPYGILEGYDWRGRMYTSVEAIHRYLAQEGLDTRSKCDGYFFDSAAPEGLPAASIHIPYPQVSVADWAYDKASGRYLRTTQGEPHLDGLTDEQIGAENVVILYADHRKTDIVEDSRGSTAIDIDLESGGRARLCRDGVVVEGRWEQPELGALIRFVDGSGNDLAFKPGQTWIQLVPPDYDVEIK